MFSSVVEYLTDKGIHVVKEGSNRYKCSSPFSSDSNWSFMIYPETESFYDFSNGFGGSLPKLISLLEDLPEDETKFIADAYGWDARKLVLKEKSKVLPLINYDWYLTKDEEDIRIIDAYAHSRGIKHNYYHGIIPISVNKDKHYVKALMFIHYDENLRPVGAKFRIVDNQNTDQRFTTRGKIFWYVQENILYEEGEPKLFIVESETSANSLWQYFYENNINAVVLSAGSVGAAPPLPYKYRAIQDRRLIIDFDGNEELYEKRLKQYGNYNAKVITLPFDKGEDINSLYVKNELSKLNFKLLN